MHPFPLCKVTAITGRGLGVGGERPITLLLCSRTAIEQVGTPHDLYHKPASPFDRGIHWLAQMNFLRGKVRAAHESGMDVRLEAATVVRVAMEAGKSLIDKPITLGIRPDDFSPWSAENCDRYRSRFRQASWQVSYVYGSAGKEAVVAKSPRPEAQKRQSSFCCSWPDCHRLIANGKTPRPLNMSTRTNSNECRARSEPVL